VLSEVKRQQKTGQTSHIKQTHSQPNTPTTHNHAYSSQKNLLNNPRKHYLKSSILWWLGGLVARAFDLQLNGLSLNPTGS